MSIYQGRKQRKYLVKRISTTDQNCLDSMLCRDMVITYQKKLANYVIIKLKHHKLAIPIEIAKKIEVCDVTE